MPYIRKKEGEVLKEERLMLEHDLHFLAKRIKIVARENLCNPGKEIEKQLMYYFINICKRLAMLVMPEESYDTFSATRATFADAAEEICRRLKVEPAESILISGYSSNLFVRRIKKLANKIIKVAKANKKGYYRSYQGILNYCYCTLEQKLVKYPLNNSRFASLAAGALFSLNKRFYYTEMVPYEDKKITENGDVFLDLSDCDRGAVSMKCTKKKCNYKLPHYHCVVCSAQVNSDDTARDYHPCCSEKCIKIYNKRPNKFKI